MSAARASGGAAPLAAIQGLNVELEERTAQAASRVGYQSEAAFNRAFEKIVGVPPGRWRSTRVSQEQA